MWKKGLAVETTNCNWSETKVDPASGQEYCRVHRRLRSDKGCQDRQKYPHQVGGCAEMGFVNLMPCIELSWLRCVNKSTRR